MIVELEVITAEPKGEGIIECLEDMLEMAKAGELSSVAIAYVLRSGATNNCWSKAPSVPLLMGSVARLQHQLNRRLDGE